MLRDRRCIKRFFLPLLSAAPNLKRDFSNLPAWDFPAWLQLHSLISPKTPCQTVYVTFLWFIAFREECRISPLKLGFHPQQAIQMQFVALSCIDWAQSDWLAVMWFSRCVRACVCTSVRTSEAAAFRAALMNVPTDYIVRLSAVRLQLPCVTNHRRASRAAEMSSWREEEAALLYGCRRDEEILTSPACIAPKQKTNYHAKTK